MDVIALNVAGLPIMLSTNVLEPWKQTVVLQCSDMSQACKRSSCYVVFLLLHKGCMTNCCFDALFSEIVFPSSLLDAHQNW